jgi:prepilin-type N-terminal cleavage/methylation domain-containing protein
MDSTHIQRGFTLILRSERAFTLIELLITIVIIAILASIGVVYYGGTQRQARISNRTQSLLNLQSTLEMYRLNKNTYPTTNGEWRTECNIWTGNLPQDQVIPGLVPAHMQSLPADPQMDKQNAKNCFAYKSDGTNYKLIDYKVSEISDQDLDTPNLRRYEDPIRRGILGCSGADSDRSLAVYSVGNDSQAGICW